MSAEELAVSPVSLTTMPPAMTTFPVTPESYIDPRLLDFIQKRVNTFVKWDLIRFFHDLPYTADSAETIASATGRDVASVVQALEELTRCGLLEASTPPAGETVYVLTGDHPMRTLINSFMLACDDSQFRIKAIYHVIRGLRRNEVVGC
jgi:hypothetical protein